MAAIITDSFRVQNAMAFVNNSVNYYMGIGRPQSWTSAEDSVYPPGSPSSTYENSPRAPVDCLQDEQFARQDLMSLLKLTSSNMTYGINYQAWTSSYYYDVYRNDYGMAGVTGINLTGGLTPTTPASLSDANFYVVSPNYNIYICLGNNNGGASTIDPDTLTFNSGNDYISSGADGYIWMFIGQTSSTDLLNFATSDFFPVRDASSDGSGTYYTAQKAAQLAAVPGMVLNVLFPLSSITAGATGTRNILGNGTGGTVSVSVNSGYVSSVTVLTRGSGYTYGFVDGYDSSAMVVTIAPPLGLGANPINDLIASNVIVNSTFAYNEGGVFTVGNDYRRILMLSNPTVYGSSALLTASTASAMWGITISNGSATFTSDLTVTDSVTGAKGIIVDVTNNYGDSGHSLVRVIRTHENDTAGTGYAVFTPGNTISNGTTAYTMTSVAAPAVNAFSGALLYNESRRPIMRSLDQIENIKTVFEF